MKTIIQFIATFGSLLLLLFCLISLKMVPVSSAKCKDVKVDLSESQLNTIKECLAVVGAETVHDLGVENGGCFFKCTLEKKGLIDANGALHKEKIGAMVDSTMPDSVKNKIKKGLEECMDDEAKDIKMTGDDELCSTFFPTALCFHQTFVTSC